jgi:tetratricopeptide (TPR) repeat protein
LWPSSPHGKFLKIAIGILGMLLYTLVHMNEKLTQGAVIENSDVVVGTPNPLVRRPAVLKLAVIIGAAVIVVIILVLWIHHRDSDDAAARAAAVDNKNYAATQSYAQVLFTELKYDRAASVWIAYAAETHNTAHKSAAYLGAGAAYVTAGQYSQAIKMTQDSQVEVGMTFSEVKLAALSYMELGNKQKAIYYYQQAIRLNPKTSDDYAGDNFDFRAAIKQLQGQQ